MYLPDIPVTKIDCFVKFQDGITFLTSLGLKTENENFNSKIWRAFV